MTVPDPTGQPEIERPIDLTDIPERDGKAEPAPTPEHHPGDRPVPEPPRD